jgi:uncharacterized membrane protein
MSAAGAGVRRAAVLGTVTGARTFLAPAALALRGRLGTAAKFALPALAASELVGDKLPTAPPRSQGPGLVGRVISGAFAGRVSGGGRGARVGAAFALAGTYPSQALRAQIVKRTAIPDIACAVPEDLLAAALAAAASAEPRPDPSAAAPDSPISSQPAADGPEIGQGGRFSAHRPGRPHGIVMAAAFGLAAAAVGTGAMTSAQNWLYGLTGGAPSEAPAAVGGRILGALGVKVKKERRPALNAATHALYGTSWGLPFGVLFGRGARPPGPAQGLVFGLDVWATSLVVLPALGIADPPWRQAPQALATDLAFHLVYGAATAAAYEAFTV